MSNSSSQTLESLKLESRIRERYLENINGLRVHILESGFETPNRPALLLLHGFPDLAYCWRKVVLPLAADPFRQALQVRRAHGHLRQLAQILAGVLERDGLTGLPDRLTQQLRAIAFRAQRQLLVQREKKRPDRSCNAMAGGGR